jgi:AcrR family transcriptional regulator
VNPSSSIADIPAGGEHDPASAHVPGLKPGQLPSGRRGLDRAFVIANQRDRILDAIAREVAEKGYTEVTAGAVIARAAVSRKTFYDMFHDKADCFLAAYDAAVALLMAHVGAAFERIPEPSPERARAVLQALLELFAQEPAFARMCIVEVAAAGPEARRRFTDMIDGFVALLDQVESYPAAKRHRAPKPGPIGRHALIGGIVSVIYTQIVDGRTEQLPELLPDLTHFLLAPYIGDKQAAKIATDT